MNSCRVWGCDLMKQKTPMYIPEKYYKLWNTDPLFNDRKNLDLIERRIKKGEIVVLDNASWDKFFKKDVSDILIESGGNF